MRGNSFSSCELACFYSIHSICYAYVYFRGNLILQRILFVYFRRTKHFSNWKRLPWIHLPFNANWDMFSLGSFACLPFRFIQRTHMCVFTSVAQRVLHTIQLANVEVFCVCQIHARILIFFLLDVIIECASIFRGVNNWKCKRIHFHDLFIFFRIFLLFSLALLPSIIHSFSQYTIHPLSDRGLHSNEYDAVFCFSVVAVRVVVFCCLLCCVSLLRCDHHLQVL